MDNTYSLNPNPIPPAPTITPENHHRLLTGSIIAVVASLVFGSAYWWNTNERTEPTQVKQDEHYRETVINVLSRVPENQASQDEVDRIVEKLSSQPQTTPTIEEKSDIINKLNSWRE